VSRQSAPDPLRAPTELSSGARWTHTLRLTRKFSQGVGATVDEPEVARPEARVWGMLRAERMGPQSSCPSHSGSPTQRVRCKIPSRGSRGPDTADRGAREATAQAKQPQIERNQALRDRERYCFPRRRATWPVRAAGQYLPPGVWRAVARSRGRIAVHEPQAAAQAPRAAEAQQSRKAKPDCAPPGTRRAERPISQGQ
jgi:hypothetical protein